MTNKDIILLQEVYEDISNNVPDWDMKMGGERYVTKLGVDKEEDEEDEEVDGIDFEKIKIGLGRGFNPLPEQTNILQNLTEMGINKLIEHLDLLGEENEENWALKNNLIRQLFYMVKNPNI